MDARARLGLAAERMHAQLFTRWLAWWCLDARTIYSSLVLVGTHDSVAGGWGTLESSRVSPAPSGLSCMMSVVGYTSVTVTVTATARMAALILSSKPPKKVMHILAARLAAFLSLSPTHHPWDSL